MIKRVNGAGNHMLYVKMLYHTPIMATIYLSVYDITCCMLRCYIILLSWLQYTFQFMISHVVC